MTFLLNAEKHHRVTFPIITSIFWDHSNILLVYTWTATSLCDDLLLFCVIKPFANATNLLLVLKGKRHSDFYISTSQGIKCQLTTLSRIAPRLVSSCQCPTQVLSGSKSLVFPRYSNGFVAPRLARQQNTAAWQNDGWKMLLFIAFDWSCSKLRFFWSNDFFHVKK